MAALSGQVPRPGLTEIDPRGPVILGVCVCPWAPSVKSSGLSVFFSYYISFIRDNSALCLPSPIIVINKYPFC